MTLILSQQGPAPYCCPPPYLHLIMPQVNFSQPILSVESAHILSFFFAFSYVGSLYISKTARLSFSKPSVPHKVDGPRQKLSNERWRDDPDVIKARLVAVGFSSITSCALVTLVLWNRLGFAREVSMIFHTIQYSAILHSDPTCGYTSYRCSFRPLTTQ